MDRSTEDFIKEYRFPFNPAQIATEIDDIRQTATGFFDERHCSLLFSLLDLTSLNSTDHPKRIREWVKKVNLFPVQFQDIPSVAAVCVFPSLVADVRSTLVVPKVKIASVAGGFPSSQTHLSLKMLECRCAVADGAQELDVVIPVGRFLQGDYQVVFHELNELKTSNPGILLKVILETGALQTPDQIYKAAWLAMESGADFIKTSTGKMEPAASPEAAFVMAYAISHFFKKSGRKVGIKPAGGINTTAEALVYFAVIRKILGETWLNPNLFRIGASRLANNLLADIHQLRGQAFNHENWF